jgi:AAA family ATP:ADP antiporter
MKKVPGRYLHGYEAVYKVEKKRKQEGKEKSGMLAGFKMLLRYPYVFNIFIFVLMYEVLNTVLSFQRVLIAKKYATNIASGEFSLSAMSFYLFGVVFLVHFIGFIISFFGTRLLLEWLGERRALLLIPLVAAGLLTYFLGVYTPFAFITVSIFFKVMNYAIIYPLRESLYIPTIKEIKFKAKSWIDAFGGKFGKTIGSTFNDVGQWLARTSGATAFFGAHLGFFAFISLTWFFVAYQLGKQYEWAVAHDEVIGVDSQEEVQKEQFEH